MNKKPSLDALLRDLTPERLRQLGEPPSAEELDAYADGRLTEKEAEALRERLAWDRESRDTVLDLVSFPDVPPPSEGDRLSDDELAQAWERLQEEIPEEPDERPRVVYGPWYVKSSVLGTLAALFFLATVGLSFWNLRLARHLDELSAPRALDDLVTLTPVRSMRSGEPVENLSRGDATLAIGLSLQGASYSKYLVELVDDRGAVVWQGTAKESLGGVVLFSLPHDFLTAGNYRALLYRVEDERELLDEYPFRIAPP